MHTYMHILKFVMCAHAHAVTDMDKFMVIASDGDGVY